MKPRRALHGPWPWPTDKPARLAAIVAGECDCACCKVSGECKQLPRRVIAGTERDAWYWVRQPTPREEREQPGRSQMVSTWPVWIYEGIRW